ncbi:hypothetical protein [Streptomyces goshikiensis]|uniref:hypothetical protein n=1 Tax=Streptomyces goshikiensis TaxID=1942 RepID=UPI00365854B6
MTQRAWSGLRVLFTGGGMGAREVIDMSQRNRAVQREARKIRERRPDIGFM